LGRIGKLAWPHMGIPLRREFRCLVHEELGDQVEVDARGDQAGRIGMTLTVEKSEPFRRLSVWNIMWGES
jgi:hypothetical protein